MKLTDSRWLALDLGSKTGWATRISDRRGVAQIVHGREQFNKGSRFEGGGMRFLKFHRWLEQMKTNLTVIDWVCFEEVRGHKGVDAAHIYGGLLAHLTAWCEQHGIPYMGVPVGTIKKHATNSGNAGKAQMIAAMVKKGHQLSDDDDDQADALALVHWMIDYATTNPDNVGSTPDRKPRRRVPLVDP